MVFAIAFFMVDIFLLDKKSEIEHPQSFLLQGARGYKDLCLTAS
ncbi:hypothetical protein C8P68_104255 [Mucilaginibacter yixingensis]|uniref:Uncharacterized protein n=1 Tax=Mucilaginibacter yixingensis TaxID=1295612 RepID=A0A2T5J9N2_9SPHI|nr:hypothetical protein C8P68_104255 [Mucilaginibacter yixingensis]